MKLFELMDALGARHALDAGARRGQVGPIDLAAVGSHGGAGLTSATGEQVPWNQHASWATHQDTDHDGIVDALDSHFGPGV